MRVLVDGMHLAHSAKGVGLYTDNVLTHLARAEGVELSVLVLEGISADELRRLETLAAEVTVVPWHNHLWHGFRTLPQQVARHRPEVVWMPYETPMARLRAPWLVICHDIPAELRRAQDAGGSAGSRRSRIGRLKDRLDDHLLGRSLRQAGFVGSNSQWVAERLVRHFGVDPDRLLATPCAPADDFEGMSRRVDVAAVRRELDLAEGFVFTIATGDPRENPRVVPEVFERVASETALGLVVAGVRDHHRTELEALYEGHPGRERVRFLPFLGPDRRFELAGLYTAAAVYLDPSLQEGFGMQVVEAMACGTPVVCSDRGALPEVTAGAALLADPTNADALAQGVLALEHEPAKADALAQQGRERSRVFDWGSTAQVVLDGLRRLASA